MCVFQLVQCTVQALCVCYSQLVQREVQALCVCVTVN